MGHVTRPLSAVEVSLGMKAHWVPKPAGDCMR